MRAEWSSPGARALLRALRGMGFEEKYVVMIKEVRVWARAQGQQLRNLHSAHHSSSSPTLSSPYRRQGGLYEGCTPRFYPGSTVADFTPVQAWGQKRVEAAANMYADELAPSIISAVTRGLGGGGANPYVDQVADVVTRRINQNLKEQVLPALQSGAVASGTLGGSRQALAQGLAVRETNRELADRLAQLYAEEFNRQTGTSLETLRSMPTVFQSLIAPGMALAGVGEQQRELEQQRINEAVARWAFEQQLPYTKLAEYFQRG